MEADSWRRCPRCGGWRYVGEGDERSELGEIVCLCCSRRWTVRLGMVIGKKVLQEARTFDRSGRILGRWD